MISEEFKAKLVAANERALNDGIVVFRNTDRLFLTLRPNGLIYTVTVTGPRFFDLECTCPGRLTPMCKHRAAVIRARKYRTFVELRGDGTAQAYMDF